MANAFPPTRDVKMRYTDFPLLSSTTGAWAVNVFRANGAYDPDLTGVGHQPMFYDTFLGAAGGAAPYGRYVVRKARVTVTFMSTGSTAAAFGIVAVRARNDQATGTSSMDPEAVMESPSTVWGSIASAFAPYGVMTLSLEVDIGRMAGVHDVTDEDDLTGNYNGLPARSFFVDVAYRPYDLSSSATCYAITTIDYELQLRGRHDNALS
jgi:hypothetical protein